jgi:hypothetical protein
MLYKIIINYIRLKLLGVIFTRLLGSKTVKGKAVKSMPVLPYVLEFLATYYLRKNKKARPSNTVH